MGQVGLHWLIYCVADKGSFVRRTIAFHVPQTWSLPAARETDEKLSPWHYSDKKDVLVMEVYHEYTMSVTNDPFANAHRLKTLATIVWIARSRHKPKT